MSVPFLQPPWFFNRTSSFGARGFRIFFGGNVLWRFLPTNSWFANQIAPNVKNCRPITRINPTDFTNIGQRVGPWGRKSWQFWHFSVFLDQNPKYSQISVKFGTAEGTVLSAEPNFTLIRELCRTWIVSPPRGDKHRNRLLSNCNTGDCPICKFRQNVTICDRL